MNYWLVKSEPSVYAWADLQRDKKTVWDGVRNFQARNHLKAMKMGDWVLVYHSMEEKAAVGIAEVTREAFADPRDNEWAAVELTAKKALKKPVTLAAIKATKALANMVLVKNSRLSVQPVKKEEFDLVLGMSE